MTNTMYTKNIQALKGLPRLYNPLDDIYIGEAF